MSVGGDYIRSQLYTPANLNDVLNIVANAMDYQEEGGTPDLPPETEETQAGWKQ